MDKNQPCERDGDNPICKTHNSFMSTKADRCEIAQEIHHGADLSEAELSEDDEKRD